MVLRAALYLLRCVFVAVCLFQCARGSLSVAVCLSSLLHVACCLLGLCAASGLKRQFLVYVNAECTVWKTTVSTSGDEGKDTSITGLKNHEEIENEVRHVLKSVQAINKVTYVRVDYLGGSVQVCQMRSYCYSQNN